jgi:hypothetical protein
MIKGIVARLDEGMSEGMKLMREIVALLRKIEKLLEEERWKNINSK